MSRQPRLGVVVVVLLGLLASGTAAARQFSPEITLAINQLVTGVTPFTAFRTAASSYLNWGSVQGSSGYGLRDSGGVIQVKDSGGVWAPVQTSASTITGAPFITRTADSLLSNEFALSTLATALILNTTATGVPVAYAGASCAANTYATAVSAIGALTCGAVSATAGITGTVPVANGGTGITTGQTGGVLYYAGTGTIASSGTLAASQIVLGGGAGSPPSTLGTLGTTTTVLHGNAIGAPTFGAVSLTADVSGTLPTGNGGTGLTSFAVGDLIYAPTTSTLGRLADVAAGSYLRSGGVSTAPVWSTLILPNAATQGQVPVASAANTITMLAVGTAGQLLRSGGAGVTPAWSVTILPNSALTGDLLQATSANTYANLASVATGNALISGGVTTASSWGKIGLTTHVSGTLPAANGGLGITTTTDDATIIGSGAAWVSTVIPSAANGLTYDPTTNSFGALTTPLFASLRFVSLADSATPPTIGSGFGTSPTVPAHNGTAAFTINVGTGGVASNGVVTLPPSATGWSCWVENQTGTLGNYADQRTVQIASTTTSVTFENQTVSTGVALPWTASDVLVAGCRGY